ncbi:STN and carboxypeptidase regulatory-like domain-containing protein [Pedobacter sp. UC225_65]|uniref:STN and carboxypeptidase regulatory-like domain-containing protein n=1 Tax=Pedobacter sp. UC225_65 TaxID=3350173 RepID=UPI00366E45B4
MRNQLIIIFILLTELCKAQTSVATYPHNLSKRVTFDFKQQRVGDVLQQISNAGNFYFAYNGALIAQDSIVNLNVKSMPVRDVLDRLFDGKVDYKENEKYIILRYAVNQFTIEPDNITTADNLYLISGYVVDIKTGKKVKQASVYEKRLLQSTLTDDEGYFSLRFKGEHASIVLTASKETYRDTALVFLSSINIKPAGYNDPDKEKGTLFENTIEELGIGKFFLSSKQRIQNINIPNFLANTPFQASLTPGLSSHGMMSGRVVNKVSLNIIGGYTAGVDGVEVGGVFNLSKGNVKTLQLAGAFNVVGGNVDGVQIAGLINSVQGSSKGVQIAGLTSLIKGNVNGFQISGVGNVASQHLNGMQIAGLANITSRSSKGMQIAGVANITSRTLRGMQISGLLNYAKNNQGFQLGLINLADSSSGVSLGLINIVKHGYHKVSFFTNELVNANVSLKTGNANLYTIFLAGKNFSDTAKILTGGLGLGHDFILNRTFSVAAELTTQGLYLGSWDETKMLTKFQTNLHLKLFNGLTIFGGPSYNLYSSSKLIENSAVGYKQQIVPNKHQDINGNKGWLGWSAGITIF